VALIRNNPVRELVEASRRGGVRLCVEVLAQCASGWFGFVFSGRISPAPRRSPSQSYNRSARFTQAAFFFNPQNRLDNSVFCPADHRSQLPSTGVIDGRFSFLVPR
jgi:hypothetical protein